MGTPCGENSRCARLGAPTLRRLIVKNTRKLVTGAPCAKCGSVSRYAKSGNCAACAKATAARLRAEAKRLGPLAFLPAEAYPVGRLAALAMRVRRYRPEEPCKRGHMTLRDARTGACLGCRDRRPPGTPDGHRAPGATVAFRDYRARETARREGEKIYLSVRPCKAGHLQGRYVGGNACVVCASAASRRQYVGRKKVKAAPNVLQAIEDLFSDENNPD